MLGQSSTLRLLISGQPHTMGLEHINQYPDTLKMQPDLTSAEISSNPISGEVWIKDQNVNIIPRLAAKFRVDHQRAFGSFHGLMWGWLGLARAP